LSERLIVEFYEFNGSRPVATVLAYYGGHYPESAALTLAAFLGELKELLNPSFDNPRLLAARFISWQGSLHRDGDKYFDFSGVEVIESSEGYDAYLVARVHAHSLVPHIEFVKDDYCTTQELQRAALILNQSHVGPPVSFVE